MSRVSKRLILSDLLILFYVVCVFYVLPACVCMCAYGGQKRALHPVIGSLLLCECVYMWHVCAGVYPCVYVHTCVQTEWGCMLFCSVTPFEKELLTELEAWLAVNKPQRYNCLHFPQSSACGSTRVCAIMPGFFMWIPRSEPRTSLVQQAFLACVISLTPCKVYLRKQFSQKHFWEEWCIYLMSGLLDNI